jgi:4-hydroxybenzoyl-CoA thioesterase
VAGPDAPGPFRFPVRVRFGDVDHAGIVYYPRYFEYFHTAFEEMFLGAGAGDYRHIVDDRSVGFPAVKVECEFRAPLRFGDEVEVEVTCDRVGRSSVTLHYRALKGGVATAEARITCAAVDMKVLRAIPIPDDLRAMFLSLSPDRASAP